MSKLSIREILEELVVDIQGGALTSWSQEKVEEAEAEILEVVEGMLPKEKPPQVMITHGDIEHPMSSPYAEGYNACLAEIKSRLKGEK